MTSLNTSNKKGKQLVHLKYRSSYFDTYFLHLGTFVPFVRKREKNRTKQGKSGQNKAISTPQVHIVLQL